MTRNDASDLTIVIPTRERWDTLRLTLAALAQQTVTGFETIIVVDGMDQTPPKVSGIRVLRQEHAGPGVARNLGVRSSDRSLLLFIGDDMIPRPEFVARHLAAHERDPAAEVAVLGRIVWHPDVPRDRLHRWLEWSCALFEYRMLGLEAQADVGWPRFYSSNVSLKRELFDAAGGFDPDFRFDYEDLDIAWRLGQHGMRLRYEPSALVEHRHPYDWDAVTRRYASRGGAERLMRSKHDWFEPWFYRLLATARDEPRTSRLWTYAVDLAPERMPRIRRWFEARANRHYLQRLAPYFFSAWAHAEQTPPAHG